jgi:DNA-binding XRE family transcriptional regulator
MTKSEFKSIRIKNRLSHDKLSLLLGISSRHVYRLESDKSNVKISKVIEMAMVAIDMGMVSK